MDDQLTEEQLLDIIAEIDTDGSGTVDFDGKLSLPLYGFSNHFKW